MTKKMAEVYTKMFSDSGSWANNNHGLCRTSATRRKAACPSRTLAVQTHWGPAGGDHLWLPCKCTSFQLPGHCFCGSLCGIFCPWVSADLNVHRSLPPGSLSWSPSWGWLLSPEFALRCHSSDFPLESFHSSATLYIECQCTEGAHYYLMTGHVKEPQGTNSWGQSSTLENIGTTMPKTTEDLWVILHFYLFTF